MLRMAIILKHFIQDVQNFEISCVQEALFNCVNCGESWVNQVHYRFDNLSNMSDRSVRKRTELIFFRFDVIRS